MQFKILFELRYLFLSAKNPYKIQSLKVLPFNFSKNISCFPWATYILKAWATWIWYPTSIHYFTLSLNNSSSSLFVIFLYDSWKNIEYSSFKTGFDGEYRRKSGLLAITKPSALVLVVFMMKEFYWRCFIHSFPFHLIKMRLVIFLKLKLLSWILHKKYQSYWCYPWDFHQVLMF